MEADDEFTMVDREIDIAMWSGCMQDPAVVQLLLSSVQ
jgi:hypothetical protein